MQILMVKSSDFIFIIFRPSCELYKKNTTDTQVGGI